MDKKILIKNEEAMEAFASDIADQVRPGDVLLLKGDLGAGKTTFTKYLAAALGVKDVVTSPTFTVVAEYAAYGNGKIKELVHADLYRFEEIDKVTLLSLREMWEDAKEAGRVVVIEWSERLGGKAPVAAWRIEFLHGAIPNEREVVLRITG